MTETFVDNTVTTRIPPQLIRSDTHGKGAAEIGWGTPGDWERCRAFMRRHGVAGRKIDGACANLHKLATGEWPGPNAHKGMHSLEMMALTAAMGDYERIPWHGPLAPIGVPTGDRRMFPPKTLQYQSFPMPFRWQKEGNPGHQGAVTVGVIEGAEERMVDGKPMVWAHGYWLDPTIIPEVTQAMHQAAHGVSGPSVDLDSYTAALQDHPESGQKIAVMRRGRVRGATLVSVPAFADLRIHSGKAGGVVPFVSAPTGADTANVAPDATFAVNAAGWRGAPVAPREAIFDADDAAKRIEAWANGDPDKMAKMFLWVDTESGPLLGRKGYRLPWGDIIDNKPYLIYHAVYAAAALLQGGHGGLPNIPDDQKGKLRTVITEIYQQLAREFDDGSIVAPWDRQEVQASGEPEDGYDPDEWVLDDGEDDSEYLETEEYDQYLESLDAALEEFLGRYTERKHPRDPRKNKHAGEWVDVPKHDAHGRIKVGSKWVYPPKKGEKGASNPEAAVRAKAKRGAGTPAKHAETRVVKKATKKPQSHPAPEPKAPTKKTVARKTPVAKKPGADEHLAKLRGMDRKDQIDYLKKLNDDEVDSLVSKLHGSRNDDDTRGDLETEVLHQLGKDHEKDTTEQERIRDKERAKRIREVSHSGGGKTTIAKKKTTKEATKEEPKAQASISERLTLRQVRDAGDEGALKSKLAPGAKEQVDGLVERGLLEKRGRSRYHITDKGHAALKGHEDEEPEAPTKELPKKAAKTMVVRKKTGEVKEHKLTDAQERGLKDISEGGKAHPASKKVLQREDYLDENGDLTDKGRKYLGTKEAAKEPPKKVTKTTVAKKTTTPKLSAAQHKEKLDGFTSREEARDYLNGIRGKDLTDLENELGLGHSGLVSARRERIVERTVGSRLNSKAIREGVKKQAPPKVEAPKVSVREKRAAKKQENLDFLHGATDEDQVVKRLGEMNRSELIAAFNDRDLNPLGGGHDPKWSDDNLREGVLRLWRFKRRNVAMREDAKRRQVAEAERKVRMAAYADRVAEADAAHQRAAVLHRTQNPLTVTGHTYRDGWIRQIHEDTGPLGIPVKNLTIDGNYTIDSGRVIRRNGIAYLIEDDKDVMADEMADFLEAIHKDLPGADRVMKGYVWAKGNSPDDSYWKERYGNPYHEAAASSGDGIMRFWGPGNREGLEEQRLRAKHEYGHNVDYLIAARSDSDSGSNRWRSTAERDYAIPFPVGWQWDGIRKSPDKSRGSADREAPLGVTDYGKSSWLEDYADSLDMYLRGSIGSASQGIGKQVPVYFRDLFPNRAKLLDELFPEIGRKQREETSRRGALTFL